MKIGIDARFLTYPQAGGFKVYTQGLISGLLEQDDEHEYILYVDGSKTDEVSSIVNPRFTHRIVAGDAPLVGMPWREQVGLALCAKSDRLDLLHSLCLTAPLALTVPSVVTVHDTIWAAKKRYGGHSSLSLHRRVLNWYYRIVAMRAVKNAKKIITVSEASKRNIIDQLSVPADRISVTYEAAGRHFIPKSKTACREHIDKRFKLQGDYVLALGSADPRKNVLGLVDGYAKLPLEIRNRCSLVIVWSSPDLAEEISSLIASLGLRENIHFVTNVSDEDLVMLYGGATAFAFTSLQEGFGLPVLEAMACGTPVVAGNNSSIPEVAAEAALLIDSQNSDEICRALETVLQDNAMRTRMSAAGIDQAARFSWYRCASETISVYKKTLALC